MFETITTQVFLCNFVVNISNGKLTRNILLKNNKHRNICHHVQLGAIKENY